MTTRHLNHEWLKSVHGFDLAGAARKKHNQDRTGLDRTGQDRTIKSHRSVIFHIFGGKLPVNILQ